MPTRPRLSRNLRWLLVLTGAVVFLDTLFFSAIVPLLPRYAHDLSLSKAGAGILSGAYPAGTLLAAVPAVLASARIGVKGTLLLGLTLVGLSSLAFGFAESAIVLDLCRFVQGAGGALCWTGSLAWLVASVPASRRGELIGISLSSAVGGSLLGPALGSAAVQFGAKPVFAAVAVGALLLGIWAATMPGEPAAAILPDRRTLRSAMRDRAVQAAAWLNALYGLVFGGLSVLAPLRLSSLGASGVIVALVFALAAVGEIVASPLAGRLADRSTRLAPVRLALPGAAIVLLLLPVPDVAWMVAVLTVLSGPTVGALLAPAGAVLSDAASALGIGQVAAIALSNVAWSTGEMLGAAGSGGLATVAGDALPYALLGGLCALTAVAVRRGTALSGRVEATHAAALRA
jgi:predicted MFS family arabinose efflux permease